MACEISIGTTTDRLASCKIMEVGFNLYRCVFNLRASLNLLPYLEYEQLCLGKLKSISIILQPVNRSVIISKDIPHAINTFKV